MLENINYLVTDNHIKIDTEIISKANEKKILLEEKFKFELMKLQNLNVSSRNIQHDGSETVFHSDSLRDTGYFINLKAKHK